MTPYLGRLCALTVLCIPAVSCAVDKPYCGLQCLYAAMKIQGRSIEFLKLLDPKYIGHPDGSSLKELKQGAEDHGLIATPVKAFSLRDLKRIPAPVIIHVRADVGEKAYKHFVLYLGDQGGKAIILDPPGPLKGMCAYELASIWDGAGLVISRTPIDLGAVVASSRRRYVVWAAVVIAAVACVRAVRRFVPSGMFLFRTRRLGLSAGQAAVLGAMALACAFAYHFVVEEGLLAPASAIEGIQQAHAGGFIPKIGADSVEDMLGDATVLVDARLRRDFDGGHLEGALSIPVNATDEERRETLAGISRNVKIVVYCQSDDCRFAEKVAVRLKDDGFSHVAVYRGGWMDWVAKTRQKNRKVKS